MQSILKERNTQQLFTWSVQLDASPTELWPFISDTNKIFRLLKFPSVKKIQLSRAAPKGFIEVTHSRLNSYSLWEQEPYFWEKPHRFGNTRNYKAGFIKHLKYQVDLTKNNHGTLVTTRIWLEPSNKYLFVFLNIFLDKYLKHKYFKILKDFDRCAIQQILLYKTNDFKNLAKDVESKIQNITQKLEGETKRKRIINRLIEFLKKADDEDLVRIHPYELAEYWGEKKYAVLNVFLHAAKHNVLDFSWDVCCPNCKSPKNMVRKLKEIRTSHFCDDCDLDFELDFNTNTHLVFTPHPLVRKISQRHYSFGDPNSNAHKLTQRYLKIGEKKYLDLELEEGTYLFKSSEHNGHIILHAREDAEDTFTFYITDENFQGQEVEISTSPNITLVNNSSKKQVCFIEKKDWKKEATYASEIGSAYEFRTLFSREVIKEGVKVNASGVTILFTDIMNSTELYRDEGDEFAIGRVMSHFKIIQQIISEERGGIVKTIGDSVMAVFREPVSALKAIERIQHIFTGSTGIGESFKLKAGIHYGDCTMVNLNDRTDYFGMTVNIAARLVDMAKEKEIIISESVFSHPDVQLYLNKKKEALFVKEDLIELKGFKDKEFKVKQIQLERPSLRLVI